MRSINKVVLIGNLTRDPELRQTPNGQNVVTFGLATNREWITRDGRKQNSAEFHELVAWAKLADICSEHLKKGKLVYVEGYLKTRSWDAPDGTRKFRTEVVVQDMIMLDKRSKDSEDYLPEEDMYKNSGLHEEEHHEEHVETAKTEEKIVKEVKTEEPVVLVSTAQTAPEKQETIPAENKKLDIDSDLGL
jgi:single-strand DNA-binding protein